MTEPIECKSEEGILVGLIDSIMTIATVAARMIEDKDDFLPDSVVQAAADLFQDKDLRLLISFGGNREYEPSNLQVKLNQLREEMSSKANTDQLQGQDIAVGWCRSWESARAPSADHDRKLQERVDLIRLQAERTPEQNVRLRELDAYVEGYMEGSVSKTIKAVKGPIDEDYVRCKQPSAKCVPNESKNHTLGLNFCIKYNDWVGLSEWMPTPTEAWANAAERLRESECPGTRS